jgi:hypothetical protein
LAGLLLPSLSKAKQQARVTKCLSNLHQVGIAFGLYTEDSEGRFPSSKVFDPVDNRTKRIVYCIGGKDPRTTSGDCYPSAQCRPFFQYLSRSEVFHCPDDKGQHT